MAKKTESQVDLKSLGVGARMRALEGIGAGVAKIINSATRRANKFLKPHGYSVSVTLNFHELDQETKSQS